MKDFRKLYKCKIARIIMSLILLWTEISYAFPEETLRVPIEKSTYSRLKMIQSPGIAEKSDLSLSRRFRQIASIVLVFGITGALFVMDRANHFAYNSDLHRAIYRASYVELPENLTRYSILKKSFNDLVDLSKIEIPEDKLLPLVLKIKENLNSADIIAFFLSSAEKNELMAMLLEVVNAIDNINTSSVSARWILYHDVTGQLFRLLFKHGGDRVNQIDPELLSQIMDMLTKRFSFEV